MHKQRTLCGLIALILVLSTFCTVGPVAAAEKSETPTAETRLENSAEGDVTATGLDGSMRDDFRARAATYQGDYAGSGGKTSSVNIHWPTVLLIVILIILL